MAWTAPRTWVAAEVVTAALMNTHVRDNQLAIDALFGIATAPSTGRVPVGDGTDFTNHAHLFVSQASLLLRHEVGGLELDISAIAKGDLITASATGTAALLTPIGANNTVFMADSAQSTGMKWAAGVTVNNIVTGSRTAAAGAGTQSVTGAGFTPTGAIVYASTGSSVLGSIGFLDDDDDETAIVWNQSSQINTGSTGLLVQVADATNQMSAVGTLTSDGLDFVWTKANAGHDVSFSIIFLGG